MEPHPINNSTVTRDLVLALRQHPGIKEAYAMGSTVRVDLGNGARYDLTPTKVSQ